MDAVHRCSPLLLTAIVVAGALTACATGDTDNFELTSFSDPRTTQMDDPVEGDSGTPVDPCAGGSLSDACQAAGAGSGPSDDDASDAGTSDAGTSDGGTSDGGIDPDADSDNDGTPDVDDECPDDADKALAGDCGCGMPETDSDADGTPDCSDSCPSDTDKLEPGDCGCGRPDTILDGDGNPVCVLAEEALVTAGFSRSCAVGSDRRAYCWGAGNFGQLGNGSTASSTTPVPVTALSNVLQVSSRGFGALEVGCAVLTSGGVHCWGYGALGGMGNNTTVAVNQAPVVVNGLTDATAIAVGSQHVCAARATGEVACWGQGNVGALGNGNTERQTEPVQVQGIADAVQISSGDQHSCAVRASGAIACWGSRTGGRLGDGGAESGNQLTPAVVSGISNGVQVSAGQFHTCAVRSNGTIACWGQRTDGKLGDGGAVSGNQSTPVPVAGIADAVQVSAGGRHSCAVRSTGAVVCWGQSAGGRLGDGAATGAQATPVTVAGITDAVQVVAGAAHSCAALASGAVHCWGSGASGRLGDGSTGTATVPVAVTGLP